MQYINLKELKIETADNWTSIGANMGDGIECLKMNIMAFKNKLCKEYRLIFTEKGQLPDTPKVFEINYTGVKDENDFLRLVRFTVNTLMSFNLGGKKPRTREKRLGLPKAFNDVSCDLVPLMSSVNCECFYNYFNIIIEDEENGWEFKLV